MPRRPQQHFQLLWRSLCAVVLLLPATGLPVTPAAAQGQRRAILVLLRHAEARSFFRALYAEPWSGLNGPFSAFALLNTAVPGPPSEESAPAAVLCGRRLSVTSPAFAARVPVTELVRQAGGRVAEAEAEPSPAGGLRTPPLLKTRSWDLCVLRDSAGCAPPQVLDWVLAMTNELDPSRDLLIVTSPTAEPPGQPRSLAPVLLWSGAYDKFRTVQSATTRTPGVLANIDLAPTVLQHLGIPVPREMEGHPADAVDEGTLSDVLALADHEHANAGAMLPALLGWGALGFLAAALATWVLLRTPDAGPGTWAYGACRVLLAAAVSVPTALLMAAVPPARDASELLGRLAAEVAVITLAALAVGRRSSPVVAALGLLGLVILGDLYFGHATLLARNLMSDFANIGARFYGMGNEYEGLTLGATLLVPLSVLSSAHRVGPVGWVLTAGLWLAAVVAVGHPGMGADFGGALSLALTYSIATGMLRSALTGKPVRPAHALTAIAVVVCVAGALVAADLSRPAASRTHLGELAWRVMHGEGHVLAEMIARKALLNAHMALSGYFLLGMAALAPLLALWYHRLGREAWGLLRAAPLLRVGVPATCLGGVVLLLLNDTGVIAWALATGAALVFWLDLLLHARGHRQQLDANVRK